MTGSSLVMALAFAANQTAIYGVGMFIVATLVTELEFLEKIAAIFWRSEPYFKYRIATASPQDVQAKLDLDIEEDVAAESETEVGEGRTRALNKVDRNGAPVRSSTVSATKIKMVAEAKGFEDAVAAAIASGKPPFSFPGSLRRNTYVVADIPYRGVRREALIDVIYEGPSAHYVIEVKNTTRILLNTFHLAVGLAETYRAYLQERKDHTTVIPVLIISADARLPATHPLEVRVLRFDGKIFTKVSAASI